MGIYDNYGKFKDAGAFGDFGIKNELVELDITDAEEYIKHNHYGLSFFCVYGKNYSVQVGNVPDKIYICTGNGFTYETGESNPKLQKLLTNAGRVVLSSFLFNTQQSKNLNKLFRELDITELTFGKVCLYDMSYMFYNCYKLERVIFFGEKYTTTCAVDTTEVKSIEGMFELRQLRETLPDLEIDFSYTNLDNVENMERAFKNRKNVQIDFGLNELPNLKNAKCMFQNTKNVRIRATESCVAKLTECGAFEHSGEYTEITENGLDKAAELARTEATFDFTLRTDKLCDRSINNFRVEVGKSRSFIYDKLSSGCKLLGERGNRHLSVSEFNNGELIVYTTAEKIAHPESSITRCVNTMIKRLTGTIDLRNFDLSSYGEVINQSDRKFYELSTECERLLLPDLKSIEDVDFIKCRRLREVEFKRVENRELTSLNGVTTCVDGRTLDLSRLNLNNVKYIHENFFKSIRGRNIIVNFGDNNLDALHGVASLMPDVEIEGVHVKCNKSAYKKLCGYIRYIDSFSVDRVEKSKANVISEMLEDKDHIRLNLNSLYGKNRRILRGFRSIVGLSHQEFESIKCKLKLFMLDSDIVLDIEENDNLAMGVIQDKELVIYTTAKWLWSPLSDYNVREVMLRTLLNFGAREIDFRNCDMDFGISFRAIDIGNCDIDRLILREGTDINKYIRSASKIKEVVYVSD